MELTWNVLNLVDSAGMHGSSLKYAWLSDGTKVSARADDGSGNGVQKRYLGSFVYTSSGGSSADAPSEVESVAWDEGRIFFNVPAAVEEVVVDPEGIVEPVALDTLAWVSRYRDCWFAGDHLGNVRSVIDITPDLVVPEVLEQNDYLPYGTRIQNPDFASSSMGNRWRYAAKEEQNFNPYGSLNLSLLDFGARMYDPFVSMWISIDPLAFKHAQNTPFNYCFSNPILFQDPTGPDGYYGSNGEYQWIDSMTANSFSDVNHVEWIKVTSDKNKWDEAMTIREANIEALTLLSFDKDQVSHDVKLYSEDSPLFTKESQLLNHERYTKGWESELNSETMKADALTSGEIDNTGLQLKFYSTKGGEMEANSLGLVTTVRRKNLR